MNLLVIAPKFFGYESDIVDEFSMKGYHVDYYDDRPSNTTFTKACIRLGLNKLITNSIKKHTNELAKLCLKRNTPTQSSWSRSCSFSPEFHIELKI